MEQPQVTKTPQHVAIIMDGNGRWAKQRKFSRTKGHMQGIETVKLMLDSCRDHKVSILTLWAFGKENWNRPTKEVRNLFRLFGLSLKKNINQLHENNICLKIIGDREPFHPSLGLLIQQAEDLTKNNTALQLNLVINYSGKWDLTTACKKISYKVKSGDIKPEDITEQDIHSNLCLQNLPDPDLLIRTSGVQRISNFMLWNLAYTEMYFSPLLWPDFNKAAFSDAVNFYQQQERRYGRTSEQLQNHECTT